MALDTAPVAAGIEAGGGSPLPQRRDLLRALRDGLLTAGVMGLLAIFFEAVLKPAVASLEVEETFSTTVSQALVLLLPFAAYIASASAARQAAKANWLRGVITAVIAVVVVYGVVSVGFALFQVGPFNPRPTLGFTLSQGEEGILVDAITPGGPAEQAGVLAGDVITGIRREAVDRQQLLTHIAQSELDDPLRLRILRDGEEQQITVRVGYGAETNLNALLVGLVLALIVAVVAIFWPGRWTPYVLLTLFLSPLLTGYVWIIIATFSYRTRGILPLDGNGNIGGLTLDNWRFLSEGGIPGYDFNIWQLALNSLLIAVLMTVFVVLVSSMAGYALSRMNFPGRRTFLSMTLVLHGFPAVTLLIPIFFVLLNLGNIPVIGGMIGFNTPGGIALVMVAFELPLGVWLMKGFFDNIPWDMERSALIDGASRWRTYWQILLPQIRPGILALSIFAFVGGWNAYLIPQTYSVGTGANLPVFLRQLQGETSPVNWNQVAAVGMFQLIPIFVFFIFAQEYLLNIYAGGTKGTS